MATIEISDEASEVLAAIDTAWDEAHVRIDAPSNREYWAIVRDRNQRLLDLYGQLSRAGVPSALASILIDAETAVQQTVRGAERRLQELPVSL